MYCLNTGLKLYDSVLVVPTFYGFYTAFGLINSTIYLNQLGDYEPWVLLLVIVGIGALIYGVKMLSAPKPDPNSTGDPLSSLDNVYDDDDEDSHEMEQRSKHNKAGEAGDSKGGSNNGNMDGSIGKKSKKMMSLKKKKSARRQSHRGMGHDEENADAPSVYGSQRGMLDDESMSTFSGTSHTTRGRGTSFTSKSSFQSDPFRTPKDSRSIHEGFAVGGGNRMSLTQQAPTHVLVDTTEDLNESDDDERGIRRHAEMDAAEREKIRRQSVLQSSLNTLTMHESSRTELSNNSSQQPPRIDTSSSTTAAGKATRRQSKRMSTAAAAGVMSPSQFREHFTNGQLHDDEEEGGDELGEISRSQMSSSFHSGAGHPGQTQQQQQQQGGLTRGHSVRWSTGSSKIDQVFEDLNPFKVLKRDSFVGGVPPAVNSSSVSTTSTGAVATTSSSVPSSPHPGSTSGTRRPAGQSHGRQDSFSGLPSEWDVPGRKKRHSMLFGEAGRSASSSSMTGGGDGTTTPPSGSLSRSNSMSNGNGTGAGVGFGPFSPGEKLISSAMVMDDGEVAPSPRTSRIMSSPEIQLGGMAATFAAMGYQAEAAGDVVEGRFVGQQESSTITTATGYNRHYFTGTPQQQPTVAAGAATASSSAGLA